MAIYEVSTLASTVNGTSNAYGNKTITVSVETSAANLVSAAKGSLTFSETVLISSLNVSATVINNKVVKAIANNSCIISSNARAAGIFNEKLPLCIANVIAGAGYIRAYLDGWAYNISTAAPSSYEGFNFNSFAKIGENYFGLNASGLHLLGADTDDGVEINAVMTTGKSDFDDPRTKKVALIYAGARTEDQMLLTARVDNEPDYEYEFTSDSENVAPTRVKLGRGLTGRYWQFELSNQNGGDFEIDALDIPIQPDSRRI